MPSDQKRPRVPTLVIAVLPILLLGAMFLTFKVYDPTVFFKASFPPIEELTIQRLILTPEGIPVQVVNGGPEPVTIAQVLVDDAFWSHEVEPSREVPRLGHASVFIPYPWVEGEAHTVVLLTSSGLPFEKEIEVAVESPRPSARYFWIFAMLGIYVGVIPVSIGLIWFPALKRTPDALLDFFLFLTVGLLVFLGIDAVEEGFEIAENIPGVFQGVGLMAMGGIGSILMLAALEKKLLSRKDAAKSGDSAGASRTSQLTLAYLVAGGIGLHNLSEGLAIGAAYSVGNISLGLMLVLGFALHNTTEGLAIVAPIARTTVGIRHLVQLGLIGGVPTIFGTWLGGFIYSDLVALLFLAVGAGAIFQVAFQITMQVAGRRGGVAVLLNATNVAGLLAGFLIMYGTGLAVAV